MRTVESRSEAFRWLRVARRRVPRAPVRLARPRPGGRRVLGVLHPGRRGRTCGRVFDTLDDAGANHRHARRDHRDRLVRQHDRLLRPLGGRLRLRPREPRTADETVHPGEHRRPAGLRERCQHPPTSPTPAHLPQWPPVTAGTRLLRRRRPDLRRRRRGHGDARQLDRGASESATSRRRGRSTPSSRSSRPTSCRSARTCGFADFNRVFVLVQATADNTTFTVDLDGDGTPDTLNWNRDADKTDPGDTATVTLSAGRPSSSTA